MLGKLFKITNEYRQQYFLRKILLVCMMMVFVSSGMFIGGKAGVPTVEASQTIAGTCQLWMPSQNIWYTFPSLRDTRECALTLQQYSYHRNSLGWVWGYLRYSDANRDYDEWIIVKAFSDEMYYRTVNSQPNQWQRIYPNVVDTCDTDPNDDIGCAQQ